jgi:hypothetical protein
MVLPELEIGHLNYRNHYEKITAVDHIFGSLAGLGL